MSESYGLFCESNEKWLERKNFYVQQREKNIFTMNEYENYFKENWSPEFQCENEIRLGENDGGKWVIDISLSSNFSRKDSFRHAISNI